MMVVSVPVRPVNKTRPFSHGALILQVITPLCKNRVWPHETNDSQSLTWPSAWPDPISHSDVFLLALVW